MSAVFNYEGNTDAFHLYTYMEDDVLSKFYVRIWRVPVHIPGSIDVDILYKNDFAATNKGGYRFYLDNPMERYQPIVWNVKKHRIHTETIRYEAEGNGNRPFNTIYIPYNIYLAERGDPDMLQVKVAWM